VEDVPKIVNKVALGEWPIDDYVTHEFDGIDKVNESVEALHGGECLRAVVKIQPPPKPDNDMQIKVIKKFKCEGGMIKEVTHWSHSTNCFMTFNIYLPDDEIHHQRGKPFSALYCLGGLTCTHDNFPTKSGFAAHARKHRLAVVFPDASPRNTNIPGCTDDWRVGSSASYYVDATSEKYGKHYQMFTYITEELPHVVSTYFPVRKDNMSITGFSMGGHGALVSAFKTGKYRSVSAFSPISNPSKHEEWAIMAYKEYFADWQ
jgi:S-formylglutathione hydrolase